MDVDFCATPELMNLPSTSAKRSKQLADQETQADINDNLFQLKREVKILTQRVKRRNLKLSNMRDHIKKISKKGHRRDNVDTVEDTKMVSCVVDGCINNTSTDDPTVEYFPFPKIKDLLNIWIKACGLENKTVDANKAHICFLHFEEEAFITELTVDNCLEGYSRTLVEDAVPTLNLPEIENDEKMAPDSMKSTSDVSQIPATSSGAEQEDNKKYAHIKNESDLEMLRGENEELARKIQELELTILKARIQLNDTEEEFGELNTEYERKRASSNSVVKLRKSVLFEVYSKPQVKILKGNSKTLWSDHEMAVGFTIRQLSNKPCYDYVTKNMQFPLPSLSSVKRWLLTNRNKGNIKVEAGETDK